MELVFLIARRALGEVGFDGPVLDGDECLDIPLALDHEAHGDALHAACRETWADLLPEERREAVADQAVEDAPCLLGIHQVHVDFAWVGDRRLDSAWGDLVELDSEDGLPTLTGARDLADVPGDSLPLAVRVGG